MAGEREMWWGRGDVAGEGESGKGGGCGRGEMWQGRGDVAGEGRCGKGERMCQERGGCGRGGGMWEGEGEVAWEGECLPIIIALKDRIL